MNSLPQTDPVRQLPKSYEQLEAENADLRQQRDAAISALADLQIAYERLQRGDLTRWFNRQEVLEFIDEKLYQAVQS